MASNTDTLLKTSVDEILDLHREIDDAKLIMQGHYEALKEAGFHVPSVRKAVTRMKKERAHVLEQDRELHEIEQSLGLEMPDW